MKVQLHKKFPIIQRWAASLGLSGIARSLKAQAAIKGYELRFRWFSISLRQGKHVVLFPPGNLFIAQGYLDGLDFFCSRAFFKSVNGLDITDCRIPAEYKLPSGGRVWLPAAAEPTDVFSGYFEKGAPQPGQIAFDWGAYCGETTLEMAVKVGPTGHVFAFEPDPKNLLWLRKNIEQSGFKNITVVPKGVWKETTVLEFFAEGTDGSSFVKNSFSKKTAISMRIDVMSPADAFALCGRVPDFIKMDIEGAEVEVVEAMVPLLKTGPISLAVASYHVRDETMTWDLITPMLTSIGLGVSTGNPQHLTTWAQRT